MTPNEHWSLRTSIPANLGCEQGGIFSKIVFYVSIENREANFFPPHCKYCSWHTTLNDNAIRFEIWNSSTLSPTFFFTFQPVWPLRQLQLNLWWIHNIKSSIDILMLELLAWIFRLRVQSTTLLSLRSRSNIVDLENRGRALLGHFFGFLFFSAYRMIFKILVLCTRARTFWDPPKIQKSSTWKTGVEHFWVAKIECLNFCIIYTQIRFQL